MTAHVSAVVPHAPYDYQLHVLQEGFPLHGHTVHIICGIIIYTVIMMQMTACRHKCTYMREEGYSGEGQGGMWMHGGYRLLVQCV